MFLDIVFPTEISYGSRGGPMYNTDVVTAFNGSASRNVNWEFPLHKYDVSYGVKTIDEYYDVLHMFHVAEGRAHSFRYKDWLDYNSSIPGISPTMLDQLQGVGDGVETQFQLIKKYIVGSYTKTREIQKPVDGTLLVAVNGVSTTAYTIDELGVITFDTAPPLGHEVRAGYEFDVPVVFDEDELSANVENYNSHTVGITLKEERLYATA